jgi:hypothetical protein
MSRAIESTVMNALRILSCIVLRNAADAAQERREVLAVDVLHREKAPSVSFAKIVETADVLVGHLTRDAQFVVKLREPCVSASFSRVVTDLVGWQKFQRDWMIERQVVGAIHFAHAAAAEQRTRR